MEKAEIAAISRLRMGWDGEGVTTLVAFRGCPLRCRWCLNPQLLEQNCPCRLLSPKALFEEIRQDELYFLATGGGVTFGGGEPLLHASFIRSFREECGPQWKINAETSLHVPETALREVLPALDHLYIDIKDMDPGTYRHYTGADNRAVLRNLSFLISEGLASRCTIRIPLIPEFNTQEATAESVRKVREMGFTDIDLFTYTKNGERKKNLPATPENTATDRPGK